MADAGPDGLMSAPPGVVHDAGSSNTIAGTVEAAVVVAKAYMLEISQDTLTAGDSIGDLMPLPPCPDDDATLLAGVPGGHNMQGIS